MVRRGKFRRNDDAVSDPKKLKTISRTMLLQAEARNIVGTTYFG